MLEAGSFLYCPIDCTTQEMLLIRQIRVQLRWAALSYCDLLRLSRGTAEGAEVDILYDYVIATT